MKTKILFTTSYIGNDYIFDENSYLDKDSITALSAFNVTYCHIIKGDDTEVIALNKRTAGASCDPLSRTQAIISHFCQEKVKQLYLFLHSNTDLPMAKFQRQPIGEYRGWKNVLSYQEYSIEPIRIWSMTHQPRCDRGAYILKKNAYETGRINANSVLERVQSIFMAEDIGLLWNQYYQEQTPDNLNLLIDCIIHFQSFPFIKPLVDVNSFADLNLPYKYDALNLLLGRDPSIFISWSH